MRSRSFLGLLLLVVAMTGSMRAQTTSGSIAGTVHDPQGAAVPNATVTVTEQDKKLSFTTATDSEGRFAFPQLQPGRYTIAVESPNFKKSERRDVVLNANDKLAAGIFTLEVGAMAQTIEVQAEGLQLKTESAERSDSLISDQMQNIAVNGRSYLDLVKLTPGIVSTVNLETAGHGGVGSISANGARSNQNNLTLNGIGNVDTGNNGDQLATISLDAVQEFKILTSNYQAEYGRSSGAQISVVTKSGTSDFHGSGYLFHRHEGLNANNWRNNRDGQDRKLYRFNDPGYTIGGPVYIPGHFNTNKDKLFFFWSQEFQRQLRPQDLRRVTVPTDLERRGDFSQSVDRDGNLFNTIKDPLSPNPCSSTNTSGCFQDGGVLGRIPTNRLYGSGLAILNIYPKPNAQSAGNKGFNFVSQTSDSYPRREDLIRLDYNLSSKWKFFGHYLNNYDAITSNYGSFVLGANFPLVPITDARPGRSFAVSASTIIDPTITNEATFGFGHNQINIDPTTKGLTRATTGLSGLPSLFPSAIQQDFIPRFGFGGRINNGPTFGTNNAPFFNYNTTIEWIDNISKVWNRHVIKGGAYIQRSRKDQTSFAAANGDFNFNDNVNNPLDTGFAFANAAVGVFNSYNQASQYATGKYRYTNAEFYIQDTWKTTPRLTLDYGMRFYWVQPQFDALQQTATFLPERYNAAQAPRLYQPAFLPGTTTRIALDPITGDRRPSSDIGKIVPGTGNLLNGIVQAGTQGLSKYLMKNRGVHFGPRLGFAYDVTGRQNMVIRAGAGVFYDRFQGNETFDMLTNPPTTVAPTLVNGFITDINPANVLLAPVSLHAFSFQGNVPTVYNYSLGVQWKMPYEIVLDTTYVGSQSRHLLQRLNINAIPYGALYRPENQDPTKTPGSQPGSGAYDAVFLRSYRGYQDITLHQMGGTSNYNSLQVSANRRFARGLFLGLAYTWGKALTTVSGDGSFIRIDNLTRKLNYGPAGFDRRHTMVINYIYEIPSLAKHVGGNALARAVFDGWQVSGVTTFQSGGPYGVGFSVSGVSNNVVYAGSYTEGPRVALTGDPLAGTSNDPYRRLNPAAYTLPPFGSIGADSPTNYLTGPGINNWDITLQKTFAVTERMRIQIRGDAFNTFNHTQFTGINSTINFKGFNDPTPTNRPFNPDGTVNNINGFGTVSNARNPRIIQLGARILF